MFKPLRQATRDEAGALPEAGAWHLAPRGTPKANPLTKRLLRNWLFERI